MTDVYSNQQARRLFGFIAAGGTLGALTGPALTAALVGRLGTANLLLLSAGFLALSLLCISRVLRWVRLRPVSVADAGDAGYKQH